MPNLTRRPATGGRGSGADPDWSTAAWTRLLLVLHALFAGVAWWIAPQGFPVSHARFWLHTAAPVLFTGACAGLLWRPRWGANALAIFWLVAGTAFAALYGREALPLVPLTLLLAGLMAASAARHGAHPMAAFGLIGVIPPLLLRAPEASTNPTTSPVQAGLPADGVHGLTVGGLAIVIDPRMHQDDLSARRFQTLFGPEPPPSKTEVYAEETAGGRRLHARTVVDDAVYAHLHTYAQVVVADHRRLELVFSPCPHIRITPQPSDYPWGRPIRFAVVDADRTFRVLEAQSGEKGPYKQLCVGALSEDRALTVELHDAGTPRAKVVFRDFAAQLSTQLSPAAGWGTPQNALMFTREGDRLDAPVWMHLTLAGTGIGIGWDSVGLSPGVYDSRIEVLAIPQ